MKRIFLSSAAPLLLSLLAASGCKPARVVAVAGCETDSDCAAPTPFCNDGACVACFADAHCAEGQICTADGCVDATPLAALTDETAALVRDQANAECLEAHLAPILFDFDSSLLPVSGRETLESGWVCVEGRSELVIEGHADERGTTEYNLALGDRRARTIETYIQTRGFDGVTQRVSYGEAMPAVSGTTENAYRQNRRGVVQLGQ